MKNLKTLGIVLLLLSIVACQQKVKVNESTIKRGKVLFESCRLCHSNKEMQRGPILNGISADYLYSQLVRFKTGVRGQNSKNSLEALMGTTMSILKTDEDLRAVSAYISSLELKPYIQTVRGDASKGKMLYEASCSSCHGDKAEGKALFKTPAIHKFEDWYMLAQLKSFKYGRRGIHKDDKPGQIMAAAVKSLSDDDLKNIVKYISDNFAKLEK